MANTFNPEFPDEIQGPTWTETAGQTFNPDFPDNIQGATWSENDGQTFNPDVDLTPDVLAALANELGLNENLIHEAINTGNELFRKVEEGFLPPNIEEGFNKSTNAAYGGITKLIEDIQEESHSAPSYQATALQGRLSVPGVGLATSQIVRVVRALIGERGQRLEQANWILQGSALIANAVNTPERLLNSPLGRALKGKHHMAARRLYWMRVGFQLGSNIEQLHRVKGVERDVAGLGLTEERFGSPLSRDRHVAGASRRSRIGAITGRPLLDAATLDDEGKIVLQKISDAELKPDRPPQVRSDPANPITKSAQASTTSSLRVAGKNILKNLQDFERWQVYADDSVDRDETGREGQNTSRTSAAAEKMRKFREERQKKLTEPGEEESNIQRVIFNHEVRQDGHYPGQHITYLDQKAIEPRTVESDSEAARHAREKDNYGKVAPQGEEFLRWASHRLRWGNGYTHLFNVTIVDAPNYERADAPPPLRSGTSKRELDFSNAGQAFTFACVGATLGDMSLAIERTGAGDLPLPNAATVPQTLTLNILDYTRLSLYNYFYAWYLNFYNPHKRRWVSGKAGKYKNIFIDVQAWYGDYWRDDNTGEDDHEGERPPNRGEQYNNRYDTVLQVAAYNCIINNFPGIGVSYENSGPFSFDISVTPSDVYYDFRNPQNYTDASNRPHIAEVYDKQIAQGRMPPEDVKEVNLNRLGINSGDVY